MKNFFKWSDLPLLLVLIAAGLFFWLLPNQNRSEEGTVAEIYYQSELVKTIDLTKGEESVFSIDQKPDVIFHVFPDGSVCFESSDCPDKVCVHTGKLRYAGQSAACLPNGIVLKIKSTSGGADLILR